MSGDRHVAVADSGNGRVSVFSIDGDFIRHVGVAVLVYPRGVACSAFDELVVADDGSKCVVVLSASGDTLKTMGSGDFTASGVTTHGGTVFAHDYLGDTRCVFFT
jgi:DNA-binding beta-propeller fold protein YncE